MGQWSSQCRTDVCKERYDVVLAPQAGASPTAASGSARTYRWALSRSVSTCSPSGRPRHEHFLPVVHTLHGARDICTAKSCGFSDGAHRRTKRFRTCCVGLVLCSCPGACNFRQGRLRKWCARAAQVRRPMLLLGASLGSAAAVDFALAHPDAVAGLVLVSPQCYTDGIGPMATLPRPLARLGVAVRRSCLTYPGPQTLNLERTLLSQWADQAQADFIPAAERILLQVQHRFCQVSSNELAGSAHFHYCMRHEPDAHVLCIWGGAVAADARAAAAG